MSFSSNPMSRHPPHSQLVVTQKSVSSGWSSRKKIIVGIATIVFIVQLFQLVGLIVFHAGMPSLATIATLDPTETNKAEQALAYDVFPPRD